MRSLWSALVEDETPRQTAYALVTIVFEVSVVTAPVRGRGDRGARVRPRRRCVPPAIGRTGALGFTATPASRRWRGERPRRRPLGPLHAAGVRTLFAVLVGFGTRDRRAAGRAAAFAAGRGRREAAASTSPRSRPAACAAARLRRAHLAGRRARRLAVCCVGSARGLRCSSAAPTRPLGGRRRALAAAHARADDVVCSALLDTRRAARHRDRGVRRPRHGHRRRDGESATRSAARVSTPRRTARRRRAAGIAVLGAAGRRGAAAAATVA
jgi:hypothetical protein